jgi:hypothetical protein
LADLWFGALSDLASDMTEGSAEVSAIIGFLGHSAAAFAGKAPPPPAAGGKQRRPSGACRPRLDLELRERSHSPINWK